MRLHSTIELLLCVDAFNARHFSVNTFSAKIFRIHALQVFLELIFVPGFIFCL